MTRMATVNWIFICLISFCLGGALVLSIIPLGPDCVCPISRPLTSNGVKKVETFPSSFSNSHKMALLIPHRDRFDELLQFVPHISKFLHKQNIMHHIFVLNQVDSYRFNRASLINVGFRFTQEIYDYIAMHDVDLLPLNDDLHYDYPPESGPLHIASPELHPKYNYKTYVGGILLVRREHFQRINGMSNQYWGWGLEDDEFYVRIKDAGLEITRPQHIKTGINNTFSHIHNRYHRKRDTQKCFNQVEMTRKRDRKTGLNNLAYKISGVYNLTIENIPVTVLNILLECDIEKTPWCDCSGKAKLATIK